MLFGSAVTSISIDASVAPLHDKTSFVTISFEIERADFDPTVVS